MAVLSGDTDTEHNSRIYEIHDGETFLKLALAAKESRPLSDRWRITPMDYTPEEYSHCRLFTTDGGSTGAIKPDGDIFAVCRHVQDREVTGKELLAKLVKEGGCKLDSYAGNHLFYTSNGFEPVSWCRFSEQFAPEGWRESGALEEPIVFYVYTGEPFDIDIEVFLERTPETKDGSDKYAYDIAKRIRDEKIEKMKEDSGI